MDDTLPLHCCENTTETRCGTMHYLTLKLPVTNEVDDYVNRLGLSAKESCAAKIILTNSVWSKRVGSGGTVLYSRNANTTFPKDKKTNPFSVSAYQIKKMVDKLTTVGLLESEVGYASVHEEARECSRFKCVDDLLKMLKPKIPKRVFDKVFDEVERTVVRIDEGVKGMVYKRLDTKEEWDELIRQFVLNNMSFEWKNHRGESMSFFHTTRIFNNDFQHGGRLYRYDMLEIPNREKLSDGSVINLPLEQTRLGVKVDGKSLVEVDYCNLHPSILFDLKGVDKTHIVEGDFYMNLLPEDKQTETNRQFMKIAMMIIINSELASKARYTCHVESLKGEHAGLTITGHEAFDYAMNMLKPVSEELFINKGVGLRLQKLDSDIAISICSQFSSMNKPICPIHDSFLVVEEDCELLIETMSKAYKQMIKDKTGNEGPAVRMKVKWLDGSTEEIVR